jgi:hypothetical protein
MEDPTGTDETRNSQRMNGAMRRKVGKKTFPWATAAVNDMPQPPPNG